MPYYTPSGLKHPSAEVVIFSGLLLKFVSGTYAHADVTNVENTPGH